MAEGRCGISRLTDALGGKGGLIIFFVALFCLFAEFSFRAQGFG